MKITIYGWSTRRLQPVAGHPKQPDALALGAQQLVRVPFGGGACAARRRARRGQPGGADGDPRLGVSQAAAGSRNDVLPGGQ
jgi:hypothetical protein